MTQRNLAEIAADLDAIPEVLEVQGLSCAVDLLIQAVARGADDLYRSPVKCWRSTESTGRQQPWMMRTLVDYRGKPPFGDGD